MADDGSPVGGGRSADNNALLDTLFLYGGSVAQAGNVTNGQSLRTPTKLQRSMAIGH